MPPITKTNLSAMAWACAKVIVRTVDEVRTRVGCEVQAVLVEAEATYWVLDKVTVVANV